jgi:hypothetical protein
MMIVALELFYIPNLRRNQNKSIKKCHLHQFSPTWMWSTICKIDWFNTDIDSDKIKKQKNMKKNNASTNHQTN